MLFLKSNAKYLLSKKQISVKLNGRLTEAGFQIQVQDMQTTLY